MVGGILLSQRWAEGLGFLSSLPSLAATVRVRIVLRPYPLDTRAWAHPPSFKDEKPPTEAQAQAATAGGPGEAPSVPGSLSLQSQSHLHKVQLAPGDEGRLGMGEAYLSLGALTWDTQR